MGWEQIDRGRPAGGPDRRATSPIIAMILMVAVTGIMATVMGAYFFGFLGGTEPPFVVLEFEQEAQPDGTTDLVAVHTRGDSVRGEYLTTVVSDDDDTAGEAAAGVAHAPGTTATNGATTRSSPFPGELLAGTRVVVAESVEAGDSVRVVFDGNEEKEGSTIIAEHDVS